MRSYCHIIIIKFILNNLFEKMANDELKQLNLIVKADVQGSAEAVKQSLEKLSNDEVKVKVIHSVPGGINESDVQLAKAANAIIIGFNVRPVGAAKELADREGVEIKLYSMSDYLNLLPLKYNFIGTKVKPSI